MVLISWRENTGCWNAVPTFIRVGYDQAPHKAKASGFMLCSFASYHDYCMLCPPDFSKAYIPSSLWNRSKSSRHQALSIMALGTGCRRIMTIVFTSSALFMWIDLTQNPLPWKISERDLRKGGHCSWVLLQQNKRPMKIFHMSQTSVFLKFIADAKSKGLSRSWHRTRVVSLSSSPGEPHESLVFG